METTALFLICTFVILIVSLFGAFAPMVVRGTDKQMHQMIAFSAGVFLGILFLILLPEAINESGAATVGGDYDLMDVMYVVIVGFLIMFVVDFLLKHYSKADCDCEECQEYHSHEVTSISAFISLAIHASLDGLALGAAFLIGNNVGFMLLVALCLHKGAEVFSLSSTFLLAGKRKMARIYMTVFCFITPVAAIITYLSMVTVESGLIGLAFAFSAGVFMFVTMMHMIPEAFHRKNIDFRSLALLLFGLIIVVIVVLLMGQDAL